MWLPQDLGGLLSDGIINSPSLSIHFAGEPENINRGWVTQQDNNPKHRSKLTTEWLQQRPSPSPDLNRAVHTTHPTNTAEPNQYRKEQWSKIPLDCCEHLICNNRKRLVEVLLKEGQPLIKSKMPTTALTLPDCQVMLVWQKAKMIAGTSSFCVKTLTKL